jgi:outer membrane protein assembly factor BamB
MRKTLVSAAFVLMAFASVADAQGPAAKPAAIEAVGKGVQIYICKASNGAYAWSLKAPDARLQDAKGNFVAKHFAGPSWQAADGSIVVGASVNASPSPDAGAIPWLVLQAKSHSGSGEMADVQYIVRTRTEGGVAPSAGCDAKHVGGEVRVPYNAIYLFFRG